MDEESELLVVDVDVVEAVVLGRVASRSRRCRRSPEGVVVSRSGSRRRRRNWQSQTTSRKSESQPQLAQRTRCPTWSSWEDGCARPVSVVMSRGQVNRCHCSGAFCQRPRSQGHTDGNMCRPSKTRPGNPVIKNRPKGETGGPKKENPRKRNGFVRAGRDHDRRRRRRWCLP